MLPIYFFLICFLSFTLKHGNSVFFVTYYIKEPSLKQGCILLSVFFFMAGALYLRSQSFRLNITSIDSLEMAAINQVGFNQLHTNLQSIYKEAAHLELALSRQGYLNATVDSIVRVSDSLFMGYPRLGMRTNSHIIYYKSNVEDAKFSKTAIESFLRDGWKLTDNAVEIPFGDTEVFLNEVVSYYEKMGDAFAEVQLQNMGSKEGVLESSLMIATTQKRRVDGVVIKGYDRFPLSFIRYGTRLKKGTVFQRNTVIEASVRLSQVGFVREIKPPEMLFTEDSTLVFLYLERVKSNYFDGFVGFATDEEDRNIKLNGYVNMKLVNNLNAGEELLINWRNNGNQQTALLAEVTLPYIRKSPFGIQASLNIVKQDSTFNNTTTALGISYSWNLRWAVRAGIEGVVSSNISSSGVGDAADFRSFFYKLQVTQRVRGLAQPLLGDKMFINVALFSGKRMAEGEQTGQQKIATDIQYQFQLDRRNYIFLRNVLQGIQSNTYFTGERFWLGGISSLRGFQENVLPATFYTITNTEYRYALSNSLYVNSIIDAGYVKDAMAGTEKTLYGIGLGVGLRSAGGLLKMQYAIGKVKEQPLKLSNATIHLSFSTFF